MGQDQEQFTFGNNSDKLHIYAALFRLLAVLAFIGALALYGSGIIDLTILLATLAASLIPFLAMAAALVGLANLQDMKAESVFWQKQQTAYLEQIYKSTLTPEQRVALENAERKDTDV